MYPHADLSGIVQLIGRIYSLGSVSQSVFCHHQWYEK
jgi:hypothetical protein